MAGLRVPQIGSAMALWANGKKVGQSGQVESSAGAEIPGTGGITALFPANGDTLDLVLQVSDFHHGSESGASAPILLGSAAGVSGFIGTAHGIEVAFIVLLGIFGLFALLRRGGTRSFYAAALCALAIFRLVSVPSLPGLAAAGPLLSGIGWAAATKLNLVSLLLLYSGMLAVFLAEPFSRIVKAVLRSLVVLGVAVGVGSLFVPASVYPTVAAIGGSALSLSILLAFGALFMPGCRTQGSSRPEAVSIIGYALLVLAAVNDSLVLLGVLAGGYLGPVGALLYAVFGWFRRPPAQSAVLSVNRNRESADLDEIELFGEDLRRPLHGIVGLAESLLSGKMGELDDEQVVSLSLIAASGLRMANEVDDLLDRDRLLHGTIELELAAVAVEPLVERVVEYLKPLMLVRSINFSNDLPRELPAVQADRHRFEQILYNLAAQALHSAEHGAVLISGRTVNELVEISVRTQPGPETSKGATEEGGSRTDHPSLLGMEVATELIRLHGGSVVEQGGDGPFSFTFNMPKAVAAEPPGAISEELIQLDEAKFAPAPETPIPSRGGFRILLADADLVSLQTMRNFLQAEQYRVTSTTNGEEVLAQLDSWTPDMLIVDAKLPEIDGFEICRRLRKRFASSELPILLLVDKQEGGGLVEGMTAGASDFISKPIVPDEFLARIKTHINLAKMNTLYSRFVPVELLHFLGHDNVIELQLGDQIQREMTILFVDIRAFTNLSEGMTPEENFKFINSYLARITPIIRENNGFIDKYIGDAILALYPGSPEDALRSAIRMVEYLAEYNGYRRNSGYRPINIGIGIHTGNLIVGIIGDTDRMQGTVISDAVNLASRVQDVTKLYGANIIISQDTFIRLENPTAYNFRFLGKVKVKGKAQTVSLFEVFDGDAPERVALKGRTKQNFEDAILLFSQRKFAEAADSFRRITMQNPNDRAAVLFLNRAELFLKREKASWLLK